MIQYIVLLQFIRISELMQPDFPSLLVLPKDKRNRSWQAKIVGL